MKIWHTVLLIFLTVVISTACAKKPLVKKSNKAQQASRIPPPLFKPQRPSMQPNFPVATVHTGNGTSLAAGNFPNFTNEGSNQRLSGIPSQRIIYFDFNKSTLTEKDRKILQSHASFLKKNPNSFVRLEGHTDERGSREYNLALGERRAKTTQELLLKLGVIENQISILSYGEEQAIALEHTAKAWRKNRRVELVYP
ncbi:peptidoglycan-associated lipoprotein Pal [Candidatus Marithrix sp. Canyon 246]|uniref:peptidoglycan-associated lipoprotein Pal n=1 Tax=Candidatus Marithrix sp. Canyon 246 TaxID=1827136 RepID=UPI00084A011B|nr:peptidoglycan-associated lipoprotein Pal [Candidatus Marithrix sp. Canyon 246]